MEQKQKATKEDERRRRENAEVMGIATTRHLLAIVEDEARAGVQVDVRSYVAA